MSPAKRDAGGYMGDWSRGAPMGRSNKDKDSQLRYWREEVETNETALRNAADGDYSWIQGDERTAWQAKREAALAIARARVARLEAAADVPKFQLQRVRPDSGGYDQGGAYWGHGAPLYCAFTADGAHEFWFRVDVSHRRAAAADIPSHIRQRSQWLDREAAKRTLRDEFEGAEFVR